MSPIERSSAMLDPAGIRLHLGSLPPGSTDAANFVNGQAGDQTESPLFKAIRQFEKVMNAAHVTPLCWHDEEAFIRFTDESTDESSEVDENEYEYFQGASPFQKLHWLENICDKYSERSWIDRTFEYTAIEELVIEEVRVQPQL